MIVLTIPGEPVPWKAHAGYGKRSFNPRWQEREYFQHKIGEQYRGPLIETAVEMDFLFYVSIPISTPSKKREMMLRGDIRPKTRPDRSNFLKFTEDCLTNTVIKDDSLIVGGRVEKWYDEVPKTVIRIYSRPNSSI